MAIVEFNSAHRLDPSPVLLYNIARSFEQLREYSSAIEFYRQYLKQPNIDDRPKIEQTVRTLELLQKQQAAPDAQTKYVLQSEPTGAEVLLDGKPVGVTPITLTVRRGTYAIELRRAGHEARRFERALATVEQAETVVLAPSNGASASGVSGQSETSSQTTWGWVAVGLGGARDRRGGLYRAAGPRPGRHPRRDRRQPGGILGPGL